MASVDVILPCLNEAAALPVVLAGLPGGYRPIVVDNGSVDGSAEVARDLGALVVPEPRPGYGAAVHTGLLTAEAEIVCVVDADGSIELGQLPLLVGAVRAGAQLALGRRVPTARGVWPWHAQVANAFLASQVRRRGLHVRDIGPARAARRVELLALGVRDRAFGYPLELLIRAGAAGWRITELDIAYHPRAPGTRSKVTGTVRGTCRAVRDMSRVLARGMS